MFGVLIERTGGYDLPLVISAGLLLVGALSSLAIDPTARVGMARAMDAGVRV